MSECHYCDNYVIGREICHIHGRPTPCIFRCSDFVGRKRGRNFYRQGTLFSYVIKNNIENIHLKFWIEDDIYAFCKLKTENIDNILIVGKKYLIEFSPRAGRNGDTINIINKVFLPLEVE